MNEKNNTAVWALVGVLAFMAITSLSVAPKNPTTEFSKNILAAASTASKSVVSKDVGVSVPVKTSSAGTPVSTHDESSLTHYQSTDTHFLDSDTHRVPTYSHTANSDRHALLSAAHTEVSVTHNRVSDRHHPSSLSHVASTKYHLNDTTTFTSPNPDVAGQFEATAQATAGSNNGQPAAAVSIPDFPPGSTHNEVTTSHDGSSNTHDRYSWNHNIISEKHNSNSTSHNGNSNTHFYNSDTHVTTSVTHRVNSDIHLKNSASSIPSYPAPTPIRRDPRFVPPDMAMGATGLYVKELQMALQAEGLFEGEITGYFGPVTFEAVKLFQKKYGIKDLADGYVGELTRSALNALQY